MVPANKLSDAERTQLLEVVNSPDFVDLPPIQIYAQLLDADIYLGSISTIYRVLNQNKQVKDRRRQARHPARAVPELVATKPGEVISWDITKLAGPIKGKYFDCYVMIDIYSRYIVGSAVHAAESAVLAERFASLGHARTFMADFIDSYNHNHRHTGIGLNTPADIHYGLAAATAKDRSAVLATARAANPHRFSTNSDSKILALPGTTWINKPLMITEIKDPSTEVTLSA
jgi:hypothetical protein